ncbi:hypothetical protein CesoFtcFv8_007926 [Champsocephalus esox]|uniref:Uncharacterized protein n=2 Tax=Champsocephalus esox TaxID=159716 RepID=A0AAN8H525_9TELE|nr:hypothetical protein CesoFtcFv8_007926 [Champsocephalus esox]
MMWLPPLLFYLVGYLVLGISGTGVAPDAEHPQDTPALDVWPTPGTMASPDSVRVVAMMTTPRRTFSHGHLIYPGFCREDYAVYGPREMGDFPPMQRALATASRPAQRGGPGF